MRLIDLDNISLEEIYKRDEVYYRNSFESGVRSALSFLDKQPTIDAKPVVHGHWLLNKCFGDYECSVCGNGDVIAPHFKTLKMNYCPNCGAKMDGGKET